MARIRTIKPEFFLHEGLADMTPLHRLVFIGLWTLADKEGRLEDRPKRIKAAILPWEDCDLDELLWDLAEGGFIVRYKAGDTAIIAVPSFLKHQRPHPKESTYGLPKMGEPGTFTASREIKRQEINGSIPIPSSPAGKGREGVLDNGKESLNIAGTASQPPAPSPEFVGYAQVDAARLVLAKARKQRPSPEPDPRHAPLIPRLAAVHLRTKTYAYKFDGGRDAKQVTELLAKGPDEEILRRWEIGLTWKGFPACNCLSDLNKHWNAYGKPQAMAASPPKMPGRTDISQNNSFWESHKPGEDLTHELRQGISSGASDEEGREESMGGRKPGAHGDLEPGDGGRLAAGAGAFYP